MQLMQFIKRSYTYRHMDQNNMLNILNQNTDNTNEAINIYFVPSDLVNPTISVGNYTNHQVSLVKHLPIRLQRMIILVQSVTVPTTSSIDRHC